MESGLGKMKKRQSIVARPSPALGVLFFSKLNNNYLLSLCLQPVILLSFEDRLLWFQDTINIGRAVLSFLNRSGVAWSGSVALLLCRLRLSKSI